MLHLCPIGVGRHPHLSTYVHFYHLFQLYTQSYKGVRSRYIHKVRWGMQDVMSNSYLLSSSPVGKVCSDPALLFIIHCIYYFVLSITDVCGALNIFYSLLFPSLHSDLVLGQQRLHQHGTLCANADDLPLHKAVKIANGSSHYSTNLM